MQMYQAILIPKNDIQRLNGFYYAIRFTELIDAVNFAINQRGFGWRVKVICTGI